MRNLMLGILIGSCFTAGLGLAGDYYNSEGGLSAPRGSQQQFDYYRQRQQYTDLNTIREQNDQQRLRELTNPCGK